MLGIYRNCSCRITLLHCTEKAFIVHGKDRESFRIFLISITSLRRACSKEGKMYAALSFFFFIKCAYQTKAHYELSNLSSNRLSLQNFTNCFFHYNMRITVPMLKILNPTFNHVQKQTFSSQNLKTKTISFKSTQRVVLYGYAPRAAR